MYEHRLHLKDHALNSSAPAAGDAAVDEDREAEVVGNALVAEAVLGETSHCSASGSKWPYSGCSAECPSSRACKPSESVTAAGMTSVWRPAPMASEIDCTTCRGYGCRECAGAC